MPLGLRCPHCGGEVREREETLRQMNINLSTVWLEPHHYLYYSCRRCPWGRTVELEPAEMGMIVTDDDGGI